MIADPASSRCKPQYSDAKRTSHWPATVPSHGHSCAKQAENPVQGCTLTSPMEDPVSEQLEMIQQRVIANFIVLQSNAPWSASG